MKKIIQPRKCKSILNQEIPEKVKRISCEKRSILNLSKKRNKKLMISSNENSESNRIPPVKVGLNKIVYRKDYKRGEESMRFKRIEL